MTENDTQQPRPSSILRCTASSHNGIQSHNLARHAIGFIVKGKKNIYYGDAGYPIDEGELFYLGIGHHYIEDIPADGKSFEQIVVYYSPEQMNRILTQLSITYEMDIYNDHLCESCNEHPHITFPAWVTVRNFFGTINEYLRAGAFLNGQAAESLKMTELIYLIISNPDCCIKNKILDNTDIHKKQLEQIVHRNIFNDVSIEELAHQANRSMTSFKKEFKKRFYEPPHKWFIKQRLMHARMMLISTTKSIAEIGTECNFPNTSHFIKLFKKEYGLTPSVYRNMHQGIPSHDDTPAETRRTVVRSRSAKKTEERTGDETGGKIPEPSFEI